VLYPQNGDRIVTIDSVTSHHPVYYDAKWVSQAHRLLQLSQISRARSASLCQILRGGDRSYRCGNIAILAVVYSGKMSEFIRHWGDVSLLSTSSCVGVMCRAKSGGRAQCLLRRNADRPVVVSCATHTPVVALYVP